MEGEEGEEEDADGVRGGIVASAASRVRGSPLEEMGSPLGEVPEGSRDEAVGGGVRDAISFDWSCRLPQGEG